MADITSMTGSNPYLAALGGTSGSSQASSQGNGTGYDGKYFTTVIGGGGPLSQNLLGYVSSQNILPNFSGGTFNNSGSGLVTDGSVGFNSAGAKKQVTDFFNNNFTDFTKQSIGSMDNLGLFNGGEGKVSDGIYLDPLSAAVVPAGMDSSSANLLTYAYRMANLGESFPIGGEKYTQPQATALNQQAVNKGITNNSIATLIQGLVNMDPNSRAVAGDLLLHMLQSGAGQQTAGVQNTSGSNNAASAGVGASSLFANAGLGNTGGNNNGFANDPDANRIFSALGLDKIG